MRDIILTLFLFLLTAGSHVFVTRYISARGKTSLLPLLIFPIGLISNCYLLLIFPYSEYFFGIHLGYWWATPLLITSGLLFTSLSIFYIIYAGSAMFGDLSPSAEIYMALRNSVPQTYGQIQKHYTDKSLIATRLNDLKETGLIKNENGYLKATNKGMRTAKIFLIIKKLLGWKSSG